MLGINNLIHNRKDIGRGKLYISEANGATGNTSYNYRRSEDYNGTIIWKHGGLFERTMIIYDNEADGEFDGLADRLHIMYFPILGRDRVLNREDHYEFYREYFDEADTILAESEKRFKEDLARI